MQTPHRNTDGFVLIDFGDAFQAMLPKPDKSACTRLVRLTAEKLMLLGSTHQDALGLIFQTAVMVKREAADELLRGDHRSRPS